MKHILIAYDGSDPAKHAFEQALDLAGRYDAQLTVLAVARPPEFGTEVETEAVMENSLQHCRAILEPLKALAPQARFEVAVGHPAVKITTFAEDNGVDLIVMGHRGKTLFDRWLIGSVAKKVMSYAPCSVLIVR
ncbi:MAG: universal stress protein [Rhodocyclaceae bacterium]|nr:universal stress protein [Rhodocyclaceae bacterium]